MRTAAILGILVFPFIAHSAVGQRKVIPIAIKVEAEGMGKNQGMFIQVGKDLTSSELNKLESAITAELGKQPDVKIVSLDYSEDCIGIAVVVAKVSVGQTSKFRYVASNAIIISKKNRTDEFVTHDVIAEDDLASLAHAVTYLFATARLRGLLK